MRTTNTDLQTRDFTCRKAKKENLGKSGFPCLQVRNFFFLDGRRRRSAPSVSSPSCVANWRWREPGRHSAIQCDWHFRSGTHDPSKCTSTMVLLGYQHGYYRLHYWRRDLRGDRWTRHHHRLRSRNGRHATRHWGVDLRRAG
jgi:hypothetical protein